MSRPVGLRLNDDVMRDVNLLSDKLKINRSKTVKLLIDVALGTHDIDMIANHYYNVGGDLFKHGNTKK